MFWKKKKTTELHFESDAGEHRDAFRVIPDSGRPIIIAIGGNQHRVVNISGTGACVRSSIYPIGFKSSATVKLPSEDKIFTVKIDVVARQGDLCRMSFSNIHQDAEDLLHHYVLDVQKKKIRELQHGKN